MPETTLTATNTGYILKDGEAVYLDAHDAAVGNDVDNNYSVYLGQYSVLYHVARGAVMFSLASLRSSYVILSAVLSLYGENDTSTADFDVVLVSGADLADTLVLADFGDLLDDTTSFGSINTSAYVNEDWNAITLNATGIAAIQAALTGTIRFGVRSSLDISATAPSSQDFVYFYGTDAASAKKPKLVVTYSQYPSDPQTRVTSLIHRYNRGTYTLELGLGEVTADFGLPEPLSKPQPALPTEPSVEPAVSEEPALVGTTPIEPAPTPIAPAPPSPTATMADYFQWLSTRTEAQIVAVFGHYPITYNEWLGKMA